MALFSRSPQPQAAPADLEPQPAEALIALRHLEKSYAHGTSRTWVLRRVTIDIKDGERALQRPCLLYHIKRCQGPCIEAISKADYRADIEQVELFLEGRQETLVKELRREMRLSQHERGADGERGLAPRQQLLALDVELRVELVVLAMTVHGRERGEGACGVADD